jgi:hypothetical protein
MFNKSVKYVVFYHIWVRADQSPGLPHTDPSSLGIAFNPRTSGARLKRHRPPALRIPLHVDTGRSGFQRAAAFALRIA